MSSFCIQIIDIMIDTDDFFRLDINGFSCGRLIMDNTGYLSFMFCCYSKNPSAISQTFKCIYEIPFIFI